MQAKVEGAIASGKCNRSRKRIWGGDGRGREGEGAELAVQPGGRQVLTDTCRKPSESISMGRPWRKCNRKWKVQSKVESATESGNRIWGKGTGWDGVVDFNFARFGSTFQLVHSQIHGASTSDYIIGTPVRGRAHYIVGLRALPSGFRDVQSRRGTSNIRRRALVRARAPSASLRASAVPLRRHLRGIRIDKAKQFYQELLDNVRNRAHISTHNFYLGCRTAYKIARADRGVSDRVLRIESE